MVRKEGTLFRAGPQARTCPSPSSPMYPHGVRWQLQPHKDNRFPPPLSPRSAESVPLLRGFIQILLNTIGISPAKQRDTVQHTAKPTAQQMGKMPERNKPVSRARRPHTGAQGLGDKSPLPKRLLATGQSQPMAFPAICLSGSQKPLSNGNSAGLVG